MKEKNKHTVAKLIKKTAGKVACYSCGAASIWGLRQPKEPENLKAVLKGK